MNFLKKSSPNSAISFQEARLFFILIVFFSASIFNATSSLSGQNGNHSAEMIAVDQSMMWDISYADYNWKTLKEIDLALQSEKERLSKLASGQSGSGQVAYVNACTNMVDFIQNQIKSNGDILNAFPAGYKSALANVSTAELADKSFSPFFEYPSHLLKVLLVSDTDLK